jgi:hypothetical protein
MIKLSVDELKRYENKWLAVTYPDQEVVGSGSDAVEASRDAEHNGHKDAFVFKVLPLNQIYIPHSHAIQV